MLTINFATPALNKYGFAWICEAAGGKCTLTDLMSHLLGLLLDDSAVAVRLALSALRLCLPAVFSSCQNVEALKALIALFKLKDNSYWLVKVCSIHSLRCFHVICIYFMPIILFSIKLNFTF